MKSAYKMLQAYVNGNTDKIDRWQVQMTLHWIKANTTGGGGGIRSSAALCHTFLFWFSSLFICNDARFSLTWMSFMSSITASRNPLSIAFNFEELLITNKVASDDTTTFLPGTATWNMLIWLSSKLQRYSPRVNWDPMTPHASFFCGLYASSLRQGESRTSANTRSVIDLLPSLQNSALYSRRKRPFVGSAISFIDVA